MSNFGLYKALDEAEIGYEKTAVGDRFVYENMAQNGYCVGGEQSGHIILSKYATTGDGILTSIELMEAMLDNKQTLSRLAAPVTVYPQVLKNIRVSDKAAVRENAHVQGVVQQVGERLGNTGRVLLRESGTEPVIRVMAEAQELRDAEACVNEMIDAIRAEGEQQAAALAAQYRAQAEELAKQAAARREQTAAESLRQADSADQLERRQCLLAERQRCIDLAFEQAASQLRTLPQEQYVQVLAHIAAETGTGSEELIFSPADREAVGAQVTERANALKPGAAFRLSAETRETGGGVVLKAGDIEYNCTFPAQLRALRQSMAAETASVLFEN